MYSLLTLDFTGTSESDETSDLVIVLRSSRSEQIQKESKVKISNETRLEKKKKNIQKSTILTLTSTQLDLKSLINQTIKSIKHQNKEDHLSVESNLFGSEEFNESNFK